MFSWEIYWHYQKSSVSSKQNSILTLSFLLSKKQKMSTKNFWKKFPRDQKFIFKLPTFIKAVIAEIEFKYKKKNNNGEPIYLGQQIKHYIRENQYIVDHCCSSGIDATMINSYLMKMRMLPMESLIIIWYSIFAKFWTVPYGWLPWSIAMTS